MNYTCNFILDGEEFYNEACFSEFFTNISDYEKLIFYIPIDDTFGSYNCCKFTESEILLYNDLLHKLGLNFKYNGITVSDFYDRPKFNCLSYTIQFNRNSIFGNKILLTFLRYLYEEEYPIIVKNIFKLYKELPDELLFNIFILAHYSKNWPGCHDIRGYQFYKLYNEEEFQELLHNNDNKNIHDTIIAYTPLYQVVRDLYNIFDDTQEFYKQYLQLISMYGKN